MQGDVTIHTEEARSRIERKRELFMAALCLRVETEKFVSLER